MKIPTGNITVRSTIDGYRYVTAESMWKHAKLHIEANRDKYSDYPVQHVGSVAPF